MLHHRNRYAKLESYLIWYIAQEWNKMGFETEFISGIPPKNHEIDILVPHIDATRTPPKYIRFIDRHAEVFNRKITDVSKRHISTNLVSKDSKDPGPVIVKTNANYGGLPEFYNQDIAGRIYNKIQAFFRPGMIRHIHPGQYPVYDHISEVPSVVWNNKHLIVERFIPERSGELYCIRICHFLGDVVLNNKIYSTSKVIKGSNVTHVEPAEIPESLLQLRMRMGFDYGKFDYVIHQGELHILDANKTPGAVKNIELNTRIAQKLANGIFNFVDHRVSE